MFKVLGWSCSNILALATRFTSLSFLFLDRKPNCPTLLKKPRSKLEFYIGVQRKGNYKPKDLGW
jgi:hypothetical protein